MAILWQLLPRGITIGAAGGFECAAVPQRRTIHNGTRSAHWRAVYGFAGASGAVSSGGRGELSLCLGFGAGAVAGVLRATAGIEHLVGVELDPMHLSVADGFWMRRVVS